MSSRWHRGAPAVFVFFCGISPLACIAAATSDPTEATRHAIIGGVAATIGEFPTVVAVHNDVEGGTCTGVLIAPSAVLTAAHCVAYANASTRQQTIAATSVYLDTVNWNYYNPTGRKILAADVVLHPDYVSTDASLNGQHDVAVIYLDEPVTDRPVARIARAGTPTSGAMFTLVGYGIYDVARGWSNLLYAVDDANMDCQARGVPNADFLCFDRTDGSGACGGDSGSPVFQEADHGPEVVGIHAWGSAANCGGFAADTRVERQLAFLTEVLGDAFLCANDGVCEAACGSLDPNCAQAPDDGGANDANDDNKDGEASPPLGEALPADQADDATGCDAGGASGSPATAGPIAISIVAAITRRRAAR